ncbi:MAG: MFS transporter [Candidatus Hydrogenedentes bacterium]|nr:MFS transporter [Candidatus Hydrogenedentota bacterium]
MANFGAALPNTITVQLQVYYTSFLGYPALASGAVRGITLMLDALLDPLMGYISDRTRSRFGRRMPYIATGALVMAAGLLGMWTVPRGLSEFQFYAYLFAMQIIFTVGTTMTGIPFSALIPELAKDYSAKTVLVAWMQSGTYVGTVFGGSVRAYVEWRGTAANGFQEFAIYCALGMVACYWFFIFLVKEPPPPADRAAAFEARRRELRAYLRRQLRDIGRTLSFAAADRHFLILFCSVFIYQAGVLAGIWLYTFLLQDWFGTTWNTPFAQQYVPRVFRDAFFLFIFFAIGCGIFFLPFWNWLGKRCEKRTCLMIGIIGVAISYGSSYYLFAPRSYPLLIAYCIVTAFFYCSANIFPQSMLADIATHSEYVRGEANEGMYYGAYSFLTKLYNAASLVWTGFAVDHLLHYQRGESVERVVQTAETMWRMRVLYAAPALVAAFFAIPVLLRYDLTRQRMAEVRAAIEKRTRGG